MVPETTTRDEAGRVLDFWFGAPGAPEYGKPRDAWFESDPAFDARIRETFGALHRRAVAGELGRWADGARSCLALIVLLDQFSRNLHRDDPRAFAADDQARSLARQAIARGFDKAVLPEMRTFFYLPFEHSEDAADQALSMKLFEANDGVADHAQYVDFARRHREVIARFGRFPHRNAVLGRPSTEAEAEFLRQTGRGF